MKFALFLQEGVFQIQGSSILNRFISIILICSHCQACLILKIQEPNLACLQLTTS